MLPVSPMLKFSSNVPGILGTLVMNMWKGAAAFHFSAILFLCESSTLELDEEEDSPPEIFPAKIMIYCVKTLKSKFKNVPMNA